MQQVLRFSKNLLGRDFAVGDLHGNFDWMEKWLVESDFTVGVDRLFGTGDLVDRGPNSHQCLHWLDIMSGCVRGNHEQMAIDFHHGQWPMSNYIKNGGAWFIGSTREERQVFVDRFEMLPFVIEVETDEGLIGITHAECKESKWADFVANPLGCNDRYGMPSCLWGRDRVSNMDQSKVDGVFVIIVGHTPVKGLEMIGNHLYIDTGAAYGHEPTVVQIHGT